MVWMIWVATVYGLALGCIAIYGKWLAPPQLMRLSVSPKEFSAAPGESVQLCMLFWYSDGKARMAEATSEVPQCQAEYWALPADQRMP